MLARVRWWFVLAQQLRSERTGRLLGPRDCGQGPNGQGPNEPEHFFCTLKGETG